MNFNKMVILKHTQKLSDIVMGESIISSDIDNSSEYKKSKSLDNTTNLKSISSYIIKSITENKKSIENEDMISVYKRLNIFLTHERICNDKPTMNELSNSVDDNEKEIAIDKFIEHLVNDNKHKVYDEYNKNVYVLSKIFECLDYHTSIDNGNKIDTNFILGVSDDLFHLSLNNYLIPNDVVDNDLFISNCIVNKNDIVSDDGYLQDKDEVFQIDVFKESNFESVNLFSTEAEELFSTDGKDTNLSLGNTQSRMELNTQLDSLMKYGEDVSNFLQPNNIGHVLRSAFDNVASTVINQSGVNKLLEQFGIPHIDSKEIENIISDPNSWIKSILQSIYQKFIDIGSSMIQSNLENVNLFLKNIEDTITKKINDIKNIINDTIVKFNHLKGMIGDIKDLYTDSKRLWDSSGSNFSGKLHAVYNIRFLHDILNNIIKSTCSIINTLNKFDKVKLPNEFKMTIMDFPKFHFKLHHIPRIKFKFHHPKIYVSNLPKCPTYKIRNPLSELDKYRPKLVVKHVAYKDKI